MRAPAEQLVFARESGGYGRGSAREPRDDGSERRGPSKDMRHWQRYSVTGFLSAVFPILIYYVSIIPHLDRLFLLCYNIEEGAAFTPHLPTPVPRSIDPYIRTSTLKERLT